MADAASLVMGIDDIITATNSLQWRHNKLDSVSNHQPHECLLNRLFKAKIKETSKLRVTGLCEGKSPEVGEIPAQRPVTRKVFPFDDVIMLQWWLRRGFFLYAAFSLYQ